MELEKLIPELPKSKQIQLDVVSESLDSLFLSRAYRKKALLVVGDLLTAERFYEELSQLEQKVYLLPEKESLLREAFYSSEEMLLERSGILKDFEEGILISSVKGLAYNLPSREDFFKGSIKLNLDSSIDRQSLLDRLSDLGYERSPSTEKWGDFSIRGDICDVFVPGENLPFRIEFFGDEVDGMRSFEPESQRSLENLLELTISPAKENRLREVSYLEEWVEEVFIYDGQASLNRYSDFYKDCLLRIEDNPRIPVPREPLIVEKLFEEARLLISPHHESLQAGRELISVGSRRNIDYRGRLWDFYDDLKSREDWIQIVLISSLQSPLIEEFKNEGLVFELEPENPSKGRLNLYISGLSKGFVYEEESLIVYSQTELLGGQKRRRPRHFQEDSMAISSFLDLKVGDYVVHRNHGIGKYGGLVQSQVEGHIRDYIEISYRGGDVLYIPSDQLSMVQRYIGGEARTVNLSKLGSNDWKKKKAQAKKSIEDLTDMLLELYAKRESVDGYAFSEDSPWQRQFELDFDYEETEDQLEAIEAIKRDMESTRPMDRLLLGDVGFGKTEVAFRAIFKAAMDSKQSVFLVPTTVLCQQHFETMRRRFKDFPIKIAALSRLTTPSQRQLVLEGLEKGRIDVVVGTHMVFNPKLKFKDLGLFVIDEEQRFGVADKEKIRRLRTQVDTLSLSATPIPRTLHLSLGGIRDLSMLRQAPRNRYPIQTYIARRDEALIREAILREFERQGQVYYIYNKIEDMDGVLAKLRGFFPDKRIEAAHGRMQRARLEKTMLDFRSGKIDLLISTTIVETGMDISNVNTLIVENAQNFGLSQLYQLRGRVGRSDRLAYAYLLYPKMGELKEEARARLDTLREFTEFGSGFKIALRDLEIRGSGSILGTDQSGHFADIGYELYMEMLREKADQLKGRRKPMVSKAQIQLLSSAYIPEGYMPNEETKMEIYRKINGVETREELEDLEGEITDRFGTMPPSVEELLNIGYLSSLAGEMGFSELLFQRGLKLYFDEKAPPGVEWLQHLQKAAPQGVQVKAGVKPFLFIEEGQSTADRAVKRLEELKSLGQVS